ncbi:MAG TPA: DNA polymerase domain-containing protein [Thermoplasmata archaeon]|nr:DNA polymerase domain-containing protein [Thermoplasmata archaeon]
MPEGWLLDVTEARDGAGVVLWVKERPSRRVEGHRVDFRPPFLVTGPPDALADAHRALADDRSVHAVRFRTAHPSLFDRRPRRVLEVVARRAGERKALAGRIDARGGYHTFQLYDVDLSAPQLFHLTHDLYPFAPVVGDGAEWRATERAERVDAETPPLTLAHLSVGPADVRKQGRLLSERITTLTLGEATIEGDEPAVLDALLVELRRLDPDLLVTDGGDAADLPVLYRRAAAIGLDPERFYLGRAPAPFAAARAAFSYESYGQVRHRSASYPLPGRFHVDRENSFLFEDAGVDGLVDAARLSRLSLQTVVRQSPGTSFTAMEMAHALAAGVHVPWKKNRPEEFKPADRLVSADRGGVIFLPPVGLHDAVDEFDFASLYPHIMVRKNLSTETLDCACCPTSRLVAPGLGYRSCERHVGLIPRTLAPLLERRLAFKARALDPSRPALERARYKQRVKMLKWVLVTAFGYQGYRNARFGRIECHEAINAYARDLLARLVSRAERAGYRVLHGLVDSLWLAPTDPARPPDAEAFARAVSREVDLPLGYEGKYRWVAFLPAVTHGFGVPNRYYGLYESGEFKLRGVGSRRHDTPGVLRRFEREVLDLLAKARDAAAVRGSLPRLLARIDLFAARLKDGAWPREELLLTHRLSQPAQEYVVFTDTVAALRQLASLGLTREPGEYVRYVVVDRSQRSWARRVRVAEALDDATPYDADAYLELLARAAETLLIPIGVRREDLLARWNVAPVVRPPYRSPERRAQRGLAAGELGAGKPFNAPAA